MAKASHRNRGNGPPEEYNEDGPRWYRRRHFKGRHPNGGKAFGTKEYHDVVQYRKRRLLDEEPAIPAEDPHVETPDK